VNRRIGAVGGCAVTGMLVLGPWFGSAAVAATEVVDRETVQVELSPTGKVGTARLFTQLTATGQGKVTVDNPTSTDGLRNLNGFSALDSSDGSVHQTFDVDGRASSRTVADYDKKLPLDVSVQYFLDGSRVTPQQVVGRSGLLEVKYTVKNVTGQPTQISYPDGTGKTVRETADIVTPIVGQLTTTLPSEFTDVDAPRADIAGDGRGGTQMTWTMVLFTPIGATTQTFGWKAQIKDGSVPAAKIQAAPVPPARKPELKTGQDGYAHGAETGQQLAAGGTLLDSNMKRLVSGTSQLMDGLTQLANGSQDLAAGLSGSAQPGAARLAAGLAKAHAGAGALSRGLGSSSENLTSGSEALHAGLEKISRGLGALGDKEGLPSAYAAALTLKEGVDRILAGIGSAGDANSLLGGLAQLSAGNAALGAGITTISAGADSLVGPTGLPAARGGVDSVKSGLDGALTAGGSIDRLAAGVAAARATAGCTGDPTCAATLAAVAAGIQGSPTSLREQTSAASTGLGLVSGGLGSAIAGIGTGSAPNAATLRGGLAAVAAGLTQSTAGLQQVSDGLREVRSGLSSGDDAKPGVSEGLEQLSGGLLTAVTGIGQLASGASDAADGSSALAAGAADAAEGAAALNSGLGQLASGASQLDSGLSDASSGASLLSKGALKARSGASELHDGVSLIQSKGTSQLAATGVSTAKEFGRQYAMMQALNTRAADDALPYGAPTGASGSAAYQYELAAATDASRRNWLAGGAAVVLFLLASAAPFIGRRVFPGPRS
jgi:putative membrane protein